MENSITERGVERGHRFQLTHVQKTDRGFRWPAPGISEQPFRLINTDNKGRAQESLGGNSRVTSSASVVQHASRFSPVGIQIAAQPHQAAVRKKFLRLTAEGEPALKGLVVGPSEFVESGWLGQSTVG